MHETHEPGRLELIGFAGFVGFVGFVIWCDHEAPKTFASSYGVVTSS
jgi:hypothetical protein